MASDWMAHLAPLRRIGFDSNALVYLLEGRQPYAGYVAEIIAAMEKGQTRGVLSTIVEMELLVKPLRDRNVGAQDRIELFLRQMPNLSVRPVDRVVARRAAELRARTHLAGLDAIIVATCLEEKCDAIVGNDSVIASSRLGIPYLYLDDYL